MIRTALDMLIENLRYFWSDVSELFGLEDYMPRIRGEEKKQRAIYIPVALDERLQRVADIERRSANQTIVVAVERYCEDVEAAHGAETKRY